jgi:hypothetical protein
LKLFALIGSNSFTRGQPPIDPNDPGNTPAEELKAYIEAEDARREADKGRYAEYGPLTEEEIDALQRAEDERLFDILDAMPEEDPCYTTHGGELDKA